MPTCLAVIPVRMKSTRLPDKPLKDIEGQSLVERVWKQALQSNLLSKIVIATDDERIQKAAVKFGANVIMTGSHHLTGSDRVSEAATLLEKRGEKFDLIANVQGDMPFINPEVITKTVSLLAESSKDIGMTTVVTPILSKEEFERPSSVKAVLGVDGQVLYFSRSPIPFIREPSELTVSLEAPIGYKHMGLYVFRRDTLSLMSTLPQALPEMREKLEQLRALANGVKIRAAIVPPEWVKNQVEVDTEEDLQKARLLARG